jgi:2-methylcitrate dehydratase PrpD
VIDRDDALGRFVAGLSVDALPPATLDRVRQHLLDAIACGLAGRNAEGRADVGAVATAAFGPGRAIVFGGRPLAPAGAALLNGFQIAAPTLGDVHRATLTHVMPEVLPAALAAAAARSVDGATFLAAIAAGLEVTVRVAQALDVPEYRDRGFHNPGVAGAVGAACAAARIAGLGAREVRVAIGHAASQAAGTFAALGTSGVKVHQARGALSGLLAAELAAAGIDASTAALTAARGGLLSAYADGGDPDRLDDHLGARWQLESIALRRWPGASSVQPVIEAALALRRDLGLPPGAPGGLRLLRSAEVSLPPRAYALNGSAGWGSRLAALQSARWTAAVVLDDGAAWLDQTSDERRADESVASFAGQIVVKEDGAIPAAGGRLAVTLAAGPTLVSEIEVPMGDPARPLSDADVNDKLACALRDVDGQVHTGRATADDIARVVAHLGQLHDLHDLTNLLVRDAATGASQEA